jgi:hypothetical protein
MTVLTGECARKFERQMRYGRPKKAAVESARRGVEMARKLALAGVVVVTLSACQTTRFVTVPCVSKDQLEQQRQAEPEKIHDKLTGRADEDIRPIAGSAVKLRAWGNGMLGILEGCTG